MSIKKMSTPKIAAKVDVSKYYDANFNGMEDSFQNGWALNMGTDFFYHKSNVLSEEIKGDTFIFTLETINPENETSTTAVDEKDLGMGLAEFNAATAAGFKSQKEIEAELKPLFDGDRSPACLFVLGLLNSPDEDSEIFQKGFKLEIASSKFSIETSERPVELEFYPTDEDENPDNWEEINKILKGIGMEDEGGFVDLQAFAFDVTMEIKFKETKIPMSERTPDTQEDSEEDFFKGKVVVLTGKPPKGKKEDYAKVIKKQKGEVTSVFTKKTTTVIYSKKQMHTTKLKKAINGGLECIEYNDIKI